MDVTKNLRKHVSDIGVNLAELARKSGVPYTNIYASLSAGGERELKANELMAICFVLNINPVDLCNFSKSQGGENV